MNTLYTVGYEKRNIAQFIAILRDAGVNVLVDVREVPWSHKVDFAKKRLEEHLHSVDIEYVHAKFAGNPKAIRKTEGAAGATILQRYSSYLDQNRDIMNQFEELIAGIHDEGRAPCIMCFESDASQCHRRVLSYKWCQCDSEERVVVHLPVRQDDTQVTLDL